jgi:hypothetical protein
MRLGWLGCLLGLFLLACTSVSPPPVRHYCVSSEQDGIANYLSTHDDEVARRVIHNELVVLRDYAGQRYQLARHTADSCSVGEETESLAEIQNLIRARVYAASYPPPDSTEWCTVPAGDLREAERSALFQYLGRVGLKGVGIGASDDFTTVRVDDPCVAARTVVRALLRHKREWTFH